MILDPDSLFRGAIRDVSQSGCFVMTKARMPLKRLAEAEIRFKLINRQFRTRALVMNVRPGEGVGFEFVFANKQVEEQVKSLIQELTVAMARGKV